MSRASFLLPILVLLFAVPGEVFSQAEVRLKSGNMQITRDARFLKEGGGRSLLFNNYLRDGINFGYCFDDAEFRRIPATYYHPRGPMGLAFQQFNWFPGPPNTYHADARLVASLVGQGAGLSQTSIPVDLLDALWSEPPVAVIGMAAGTPASYARPFQHFHFFEENADLIKLNQRKGKDAFFHFISDARVRGGQFTIFHGPPRQQLRDRGPRKFYRLIVLQACTGENGEKIYLDLFTKEGIARCFDHLADDGVLCVHTSHRFVDLPPVLGAIAKELKIHVQVGQDFERTNLYSEHLAQIGHWTSEWVLLARNKKVLTTICKPPADYQERNEYWSEPRPFDQVWTDKGPNLLHGVLRGHPMTMRYATMAEPVVDFLHETALRVGISNPRSLFFSDLRRMPRPMEEWFIRNQLAKKPHVEALWP